MSDERTIYEMCVVKLCYVRPSQCMLATHISARLKLVFYVILRQFSYVNGCENLVSSAASVPTIVRLQLRGLTPVELERNIRDSLTTVNLTGLDDALPAELSAVMKRRLSIAIAAIAKPQVKKSNKAKLITFHAITKVTFQKKSRHHILLSQNGRQA